MTVVIGNLKPTITCPATLYLASDHGKFVEHKFEVMFRRLTTEERDELNVAYTIGKMVPAEPTSVLSAQPPAMTLKRLTNAELLDKIVEGWGGMNDAAGQPVPYSHAERRATDSTFSGTEQAMVVSWFDHSFVNQREAAAKNSKAPSGTTSAETTQGATS